jgi:hypothetical protein
MIAIYGRNVLRRKGDCIINSPYRTKRLKEKKCIVSYSQNSSVSKNASE